MRIVCFFFFQAEDGIRDGHVTGVQTCALPISPASDRRGTLDRCRLLVRRVWRREDRTRGDRIDEDLISRQLERERFCQGDDSRLRDVIRQIAGIPWPT